MKEKLTALLHKLVPYKLHGLALLALLLTVTAFAVGIEPQTVTAMASKRELPIYSLADTTKRAALTFDAAWGNEDTQQLIDILKEYNVHATFFVVGDWARKYPDSVKALHDAGHEIMSHSNKHEHMPQLSPEQIVENIKTSNADIEKITGARVTLFRFPYGEYDDKSVRAVRGMGIEPVQWDVDSLDWKDLPADQITQRVTSRVKPGSIVLFHNAAKHTPAALPDIIKKLQADGYSLVKLSEMVLRDSYRIDHEGRQHALKPGA